VAVVSIRQVVDPSRKWALDAERLHLKTERAELGDRVGELQVGLGRSPCSTPNPLPQWPQHRPHQRQGDENGCGGRGVHHEPGHHEGRQAQSGGDGVRQRRYRDRYASDERRQEFLETTRGLARLGGPARGQVRMGQQPPLILGDVSGEPCGDPDSAQIEGQAHQQDGRGDEQCDVD
jgi:hypothetical protein